MNTQALEDKLVQQVGSVNNAIISPSNVVPMKKDTNFEPVNIPNLVITIDEAKERIKLLQSFVNDIMVPGQDYGLIPNTNKPTLFKSGAEKLTDIFGFSKHIEVTHRVEDWNQGLFHYEVKATLISKATGNIEAEGIGSCNNKESKYVNQNAFNIINTLIKMAKKRAFIDAVLSATRASGLFTQDLDDLLEGSTQEQPKDLPIQSNPKTVSDRATKPQLNAIQKLVSLKRIPIQQASLLIESRYSVEHSKQLSKKQASDFITFLNEYK